MFLASRTYWAAGGTAGDSQPTRVILEVADNRQLQLVISVIKSLDQDIGILFCELTVHCVQVYPLAGQSSTNFLLEDHISHVLDSVVLYEQS